MDTAVQYDIDFFHNHIVGAEVPPEVLDYLQAEHIPLLVYVLRKEGYPSIMGDAFLARLGRFFPMNPFHLYRLWFDVPHVLQLFIYLVCEILGIPGR